MPKKFLNGAENKMYIFFSYYYLLWIKIIIFYPDMYFDQKIQTYKNNLLNILEYKWKHPTGKTFST